MRATWPKLPANHDARDCSPRFVKCRYEVDSRTLTTNCLAEFQIPQQVARYASFMFSFLGRGLCKHTASPVHATSYLLINAVYVFIGSVIVGEKWFRIVPGTIVGIIGIGYAVLEYIPSIEPPANMR